MQSNIKDMTERVLGEYLSLREFYYDLHAHPELSFQEWQTAERIVARLRSGGIECRTVAGTGVIATIEGAAAGADLRRAVVLRADIDALPIEEPQEVPYASQHKGVMHACGHDMHATVLLGALELLNERREELGCTIIGIFQPGEELNPGGAKLLLEEGVLEGYRVEAVIGEHIEPTLPTGNIGICAGRYMAACDELHISVCGKGGHAALRESIQDPILPTAKLIERLYGLPSEAPEGVGQTIVSIGKIDAPGATNVVPDRVELQGTMRTFDEGWRGALKWRIAEVCDSVAQEYGVSVEYDFGNGYPSVYNDPALAARAREILGEYFGVEELAMRPTGEDFGYYTERYPSLFYRLGVGYTGEEFESAKAGRLHTPSLLPDTKAIGIGVVAMAMLALRLAHK